MTGPQSLVATVLKENYFKHVNVMEARVRENALFMWQSITTTREVLKKGVQWRLGNGSTIKIWNDKWLPTPTNFQVQSPVLILHEDNQVQDLLTTNWKGWNVSLV